VVVLVVGRRGKRIWKDEEEKEEDEEECE